MITQCDGECTGCSSREKNLCPTWVCTSALKHITQTSGESERMKADEGATALVRSRETGDERTVRADYLVAAVGPRSPVREQLGIGHTGAGDLFHSVSIAFEAKRLAEAVGDRRFFCAYLTNEQGPGVLLPVDNKELWVLHAYSSGAEYDLVLEDGSDWAQAHGTDSDGAVLVRPDGFVAWRARTSGTDPEGTLTDVLDTVLSRR
jgi:2-polyprenyl-6-methoxyphenol hydroxylase-like FAD-dependent oxidoreductase